MELKNKIFAGILSATLVSGAVLWEGTRYVPYEDIVGVLTVCHGYTGKDIVRGKRYTDQECKAFLSKELIAHQADVIRCVNKPMTQNQVDAFTLFTYNVGGAAFCGSTLLKKFNQGDIVGACNGLLQWSYAGGKYIQGLNNRREFERKICLGETNG